MLAPIVNVPEGDLLGKTTGLGATVGTDTGVARATGVFVGSTVAIGTHTVGLAGVSPYRDKRSLDRSDGRYRRHEHR